MRIHKAELEVYRASFDYSARLVHDPLEFAHRYQDPRDVEVAAFIAAMMAYGRVSLFKPVVEKILEPMGKSPAAFLADFRPGRERKRFAGLYYRLSRSEDLLAFLYALSCMTRRYESLEDAFLAGDDPEDPTVGVPLTAFMGELRETDTTPVYGRKVPLGGPRGFLHLFPSPRTGGAAKRACLFLRWVVRRHDVDLGIWRRVSPARLVIPLDTHIQRIARCLGLTRRATPGWAMAVEVTDGLKKLDPEDPLKYDFPLCHLGIRGDCPPRVSGAACARCDLAPLRRRRGG